MKKLLPFFVLLCMLAAVACTKYKDDPFISFRSPEKRLYGHWKLITFEVDGADSLSNLATYCPISNCYFHFYYDKNNSTHKLDGCINDWYTNWGFFHGGNIKEFNTGNYFIYPICKYFPDGTIDPSSLNTVPYNVLKLYKNDFWIESHANGKIYTIKFSKQ